MNETKLREACGSDERAYRYLSEAARRLEAIIGTKLGEKDCIALIHLVTERTLEFADGFVINKLSEYDTILSYSDAAAIAASIHDAEGRNWEWFRAEFQIADTESEVYEARFRRLLKRVDESSGVTVTF
jgi:hypothetical protein